MRAAESPPRYEFGLFFFAFLWMIKEEEPIS
jgi:hypothetical protein